MKLRFAFLSLCLLGTSGVTQQTIDYASIVPPAYGHAMVHDEVRGCTVLFGGGRFENSGLPVPLPSSETWVWDGRWSELTPTTRPPGREFASLAFDTGRREVVLFGGDEWSNALRDDTWTWDGVDWTERSPAQHPSARERAAMAHDGGRGVCVLFGGFDGSLDRADTWEWDGVDWTQRTPATSPPALASTLVYDGGRARTMLVNLAGETWTWNGVDWTRLIPVTPLPSSWVEACVMAYDAALDRVTLTAVGDGSAGASGETWEWDGSDWAQRSPVRHPSTRGARLAYDSGRQRVLSFGGELPLGNPLSLFAPREFAADVEMWDGAEWAVHTPRQFPNATFKHAMAYDARAAEVVMFGGERLNGAGALDETWIWDGAGGAWASRESAHRPAARSDHAMAAAATGSIVLFGGVDAMAPNGGAALLGDTWTWDGVDWLGQTPAVSPSPRQGHVMALDAARGEVLLFGGDDGAPTNDTWVWSRGSWEQRFPAHSPPAMLDSSMAYDAARDRMVLAGETGTWEWDGRDWWLGQSGRRTDPLLGYDASRGLVYSRSSFQLDVWDGVGWTSMASLGSPVTRPGSTVDHAMSYHAATDRFVIFGGVLLGSQPFTARTLNETVLFGPSEPALYSRFGTGCAGTAGTPRLEASGVPRPGGVLSLDFTHLPMSRLSVPFGVLGFSRTDHDGLGLPLDLGPIGMPSCTLYLSPTIAWPLENRGGAATWNLAIPNDPGVLGLRFYTQGFVVDAWANPLGVTTTGAGAARVGTTVPVSGGMGS